ncbi:SOUL family heme-binding protein [Halosolutus amylolyticus]|uniref:SOUL family heme-binding protein n=1 Tax=Halosolutus amylolyticus TaxID=2932267 RepID=A0ABD5PQU5_9EURY|nr:heme-binding protein [Halosolutus amylolyticus]
MRTRVTALASVVTGLLAAWIGWGLYVITTTERVPSETLDRDGAFERRRYPATVLVETTAPDERTAFRRLFRYIGGDNGANDEISMTAPVTTSGRARSPPAPGQSSRRDGESVAMTAPVRTERADEAVTMGFFLPPEYTLESAPAPIDPDVHLVLEPPRTVAAYRFSWYATAGRVERARDALLAKLDDRGLEPRDDPVLLQYNDPWTPPFMRRNEVAVTLEN